MRLVPQVGHGQGVPDEDGLEVVVPVARDDAVADDVRAGVAVELDLVVRVVVARKCAVTEINRDCYNYEICKN